LRFDVNFMTFFFYKKKKKKIKENFIGTYHY
jgi:hypothetical protein